jgi:hypothetical protein
MPTEGIIKNFPTKKSPRLDEFTADFCQIIKEKLRLMLLKLFHQKEMEGTLPKPFFEPSVILIAKQDKDKTKREITNKFL